MADSPASADADWPVTFADPADQPVRYLERIREYYLALGYPTPYQWAHYRDVPFCKPAKSVRDARLAIVTTAAPYNPEAGDQGPEAPYNGAAKFFSVYAQQADENVDLRVSHIAYDRKHSPATDMSSWFPQAALASLADSGQIGALNDRFFGFPTDRSHRVTLAVHCPALLSLLVEDKIDLCVLVANCPVCHQSMALAARYLERAGIATVVLGCARDIVEYAGVPRLLFSDFLLGNAAGIPHHPASQRDTAAMAIDLLENATAARTTVQSPWHWSEDVDWKLDYSNAQRLSPAELARLREEFDQQKKAAREVSSRT